MSEGVTVWGLSTFATTCKHDERRFKVPDTECNSSGPEVLRDSVYLSWDMISHLGPGALDGLRCMPPREEWPPEYWYLQEIPPTAYSPPDSGQEQN